MDDPKTFPLVLPPILHQRLKLLAVERKTTLRELIITAIEKVYKVKAA
jgi:hypothetical protein